MKTVAWPSVVLLCAALGLLAGCATRGELERPAVLAQAAALGWSSETLSVDGLALRLWRSPGRVEEGLLVVYLEGDGAAWATPYHPPRDPTPDEPLALALALRDGRPAVVYLARPCQFLDRVALLGCPMSLWTDQRFSPQVVAAFDRALDVLKARNGATRLELIGYSGGGVLAAWLAGQREDVARWVTIAAPLALRAWTEGHGLAPLDGDPFHRNLRLPEGLHFVGGQDRIVPPSIVRRFVTRHGGRLVLMPDFDHHCCWHRHWPALIATPPASTSPETLP